MATPDDGVATPATLLTRTRRGVAWAAVSRLSVQATQFVGMIVLSRLLAPEQYGLVGIVAVFVGFAFLFTTLGLGAAVVQLRDPRQAALSAAFWLSAGSGVAVTLLLMAVSPGVAAIYDRPELTRLLLIASLGPLLSLGTVHVALLERSMRFDLVLRVEVAAVVVGTAVSIGAALAGRGAESLVLGALAANVVGTVTAWWAYRWRPSLHTDRQSFREIWLVVRPLIGFSFVSYWTKNTDNLLVGRFVGTDALGVYARAFNLMSLPVQAVTIVLGRVLFPALVELRDDLTRLRGAFLRAVKSTSLILFPVAGGMAASAPAFVAVAFGAQWSETAPLLTLLAAAAPVQILAGTFGPVYKAIGRNDVLFRRGLVIAGIFVCGVVAGLPWGARGVATAYLFQSYLVLFTILLPTVSLVGCRKRDYLRELIPASGSTVVMALAVTAAGQALAGSPAPAVLAVQVGTGLVTYTCMLLLVTRSGPRGLRKAVMG